MNHFLTSKRSIIKTYGDICMNVASFLPELTSAKTAAAAKISKMTILSESAGTRSVAVILMKSTISITVETVTSSTTVGSSMEHIPEDITEHVTHICTVKMKFLITAILTGTGSTVLISTALRHTAVKGCMAKLIVQFPFLRITQDRISLCHILELLLRCRISGVGIRMILLCKFSICFFYRRGVCIFCNAE